MNGQNLSAFDRNEERQDYFWRHKKHDEETMRQTMWPEEDNLEQQVELHVK
jgi:hypothetical protein